MIANPLSEDIISLVHHVSLNETGWWNKSMTQIIEVFLWKYDLPITSSDLHALICRELGVDAPAINTTKLLAALSSTKDVIYDKHKLTYILCNERRRALSELNKNAEKEHRQAQELFITAASHHCGEPVDENVWLVFYADLKEAIHKVGANTYNLLVNGEFEREGDWLTNFILSQPHDYRDGMRIAIAKFFGSKEGFVKSIILRLLSAHFFAEATQLKPETLAVLETKRKNKDIKLVLDTNFVFAILGLDDSANDAAASLVELISKVKSVDIRLYVLPTTLEEIKAALSIQMNRLESRVYSQGLSKAALNTNISGIARKFFEKSNQAGGLSPTVYFNAYIEGLRFVLKDKGIDILEWPLDFYYRDQRFIDDLNDLLETEGDREGGKSYEMLNHDLVLWYAIKDHRSSNAESLLEESFWGVTLDSRLLSFDLKKRKAVRNSLPVVLYPTNLIQLLQFWVPRSEFLENSVLDSLKMPLFAHGFDKEDEAVTISIVNALTTYDNIDGLGHDALTSILANQALRVSILSSDKRLEVAEKIELEVINEAAKIRMNSEALAESLEISNNESFQLSEQMQGLKTTLTEKSLQADSILVRAQAAEALLEARYAKDEKRSFLILFVWIPMLVIGTLSAFLIYNFWGQSISSPAVIISLGFVALIIFIQVQLSAWKMARSERLKKWWLADLMQHTYTKVCVPLIPGALWVFDYAKGFLPKSD